MARLRVATVIDAPTLAVQRALRRRAVWVAAFRSCDLRAVSSPTPSVGDDAAPSRATRFAAAGDTDRSGVDEWTVGAGLQVRSTRHRGRSGVRVTAVGDQPEVRLRFGRVTARGRFHLAPTAAGVLVTFDLLIDAPLLQGGRARARLLRFGENLLEAAAVDAAGVTVVVAGAVRRQGRVLAARRTRPVDLAGKWEMPGGKVEPGETEPAALARELREELGIEVVVGERIGPAFWVGTDLVLHAHLADWVSGEPTPLEADPAHDEVRWLAAADLDDVDWLPGDAPFVVAVRDRLSTDPT